MNTVTAPAALIDLLPKSGKTLVADAIDAGHTVTVTGDQHAVCVDIVASVEHRVEVGVVFSRQAVYAGRLADERLGFRTSSPERWVMKFDYATSRNGTKYEAPRSVRQARAAVWLAI